MTATDVKPGEEKMFEVCLTIFSPLIAEIGTEFATSGCCDEELCLQALQKLTVRQSRLCGKLPPALQGMPPLEVCEEETWCHRSEGCRCPHGLSYGERLAKLENSRAEKAEEIAAEISARIHRESVATAPAQREL